MLNAIILEKRTQFVYVLRIAYLLFVQFLKNVNSYFQPFLKIGWLLLLEKKAYKLVCYLIDCGDPPDAPQGGELIAVNTLPDGAGTYAPGSIATYQCLDGYAPIGGSPAVTCLPNGMWEDLTLLCPRGD